MQNSQDLTTHRKPRPSQTEAAPQERRAQPRPEGVLSKIEDATYEVLRKHQKTVA